MKKLLSTILIAGAVSFASAAMPSNWAGNYRAVISSLDSNGTDLSVKLNSDNTYSQTITQFGKDGKNTTSTKTGKFVWDGQVIYFDDNSTSYVVTSDRLLRINVPANVIKALGIDYYTLGKTNRIVSPNSIENTNTNTTGTKKIIPVLSNVVGSYNGILKCGNEYCDTSSTILVLNSNGTYYKRNAYVGGTKNGQTEEKRGTYSYKSLIVTLDEGTSFKSDEGKLYILGADGAVVSSSKLDGYVLSK